MTNNISQNSLPIKIIRYQTQDAFKREPFIQMQTQKRTINDVRSILGDTVQPKLLNIFYLRDDGDIIPPGITNQPDDFLGDPTIGKGFSPSRRPKENHYSLEPKNLYDVTGQRLHA